MFVISETTGTTPTTHMHRQQAAGAPAARHEDRLVVRTDQRLRVPHNTGVHLHDAQRRLRRGDDGAVQPW